MGARVASPIHAQGGTVRSLGLSLALPASWRGQITFHRRRVAAHIEPRRCLGLSLDVTKSCSIDDAPPRPLALLSRRQEISTRRGSVEQTRRKQTSRRHLLALAGTNMSLSSTSPLALTLPHWRHPWSNRGLLLDHLLPHALCCASAL